MNNVYTLLLLFAYLTYLTGKWAGQRLEGWKQKTEKTSPFSTGKIDAETAIFLYKYAIPGVLLLITVLSLLPAPK